MYTSQELGHMSDESWRQNRQFSTSNISPMTCNILLTPLLFPDCQQCVLICLGINLCLGPKDGQTAGVQSLWLRGVICFIMLLHYLGTGNAAGSGFCPISIRYQVSLGQQSMANTSGAELPPFYGTVSAYSNNVSPVLIDILSIKNVQIEIAEGINKPLHGYSRSISKHILTYI